MFTFGKGSNGVYITSAGPRMNGAYVNDANTKAIVFTCCGENDDTEKRFELF